MDEDIYDTLAQFDLEDVEVEGTNPSIKYVGRLTRNLEYRERTYVYFFGIPYAKPPIGDLRFQPPQEYQPEEGQEVYRALRVKSKSYQKNFTQNDGVGSEDCLYLNVYVPKLPDEIQEPLAVLVYFHGGGLSRGSGNYDEITPDSLMREDIVFVTVNYRLGVFGFLNLRSSICKGNAGLKDQVMALEWIKKNIRAFGGNPENVTISGASAGGSCVNFHLISPRSRGLFHKAIVQSGGVYCPWGFTGHHRMKMGRFKEYRNQTHYSRDKFVEELELLETEALRQIYQKFFLRERNTKQVDMNIYLGPSSEIPSEDAFLCCDKIEDLMVKQSQPVPILAGIVEKEGYMAAGNFREKGLDWIKDRKDFIKFLEVNLRWYEKTAAKHVNGLQNKYFPNLSRMSDAELCDHFVNFCTDLWFHRFYDNFEFGDANDPNKHPLFVYKFNCLTEFNNMWRIFLGRETDGAGHGDECQYLYPSFASRIRSVPYREHIQNKVKNICSLWASFCKKGIPESSCYPEVKWPPHTKDNPCYMSIDNAGLTVERRLLNEDRWKFMRETILSESKIPSPLDTPTPTPGCIVVPADVWPVHESVDTAQESRPEMEVACSSKSIQESSEQAEGEAREEDQGSSEVPLSKTGSTERPSTLALTSICRPSGETPDEQQEEET